MDRASDCAARSTGLSAQLWRVERRKHYGGVPVRLTGNAGGARTSAYDDASGQKDQATRCGEN